MNYEKRVWELSWPGMVIVNPLFHVLLSWSVLFVFLGELWAMLPFGLAGGFFALLIWRRVGGMYNPFLDLIVVRKDLPPSLKKEVLAHELRHRRDRRRFFKFCIPLLVLMAFVFVAEYPLSLLITVFVVGSFSALRVHLEKRAEGIAGLCVTCGKPMAESRRILTCSEECHERLVEKLIRKFGEFKRVVDAETGKAHRVPIRDIIERGLKHEDLAKYPLWDE